LWSLTGKPVALSSTPVGRNPEQEPAAKAGARVEWKLSITPVTSSKARPFTKVRRRPGKTRSKARSVSKRCALLRLSDLAVDLNPIGLSAGSSEMIVLDAKVHL